MRPDSARWSSIQARMRSWNGFLLRSPMRRGDGPKPSMAINLATFSG
jgi:hypothetical protein